MSLLAACGGVRGERSDADPDAAPDLDADLEPDADDAEADSAVDAAVDSDGDGDDGDVDTHLESCVCQPGANRYCSTPDGLGTQRCNDNGDGWGACDESTTPDACLGLTPGSLELFLCVLHENACLEDWPDADRDGDRDESLGRCYEVICTPPDCFCVPGSWRVCDVPAYTFGGVCYCTNDGTEWGPGLEQFPLLNDPCMSPNGWCYPECTSCLLDAGNFCVQDMWDSDSDSDTWESVGNCEGVVCGF